MEGGKQEGREDRAKGVLIGLLAGDQNGGPIRMAVRLAESLIEHGGYNREDVITRYSNWHKGPPHDTVFTQYHRGKSIEEASEMAKESAGINAAHRSAPLAICKAISDEELVGTAKTESRITHVHALSVECCAAANYLIRQLINGVEWTEAKQRLFDSGIIESRETKVALQEGHQLSKGGFAPEVLGAALHFLDTNDTFDDALNHSLQFAGSPNFCPVLVGSIGGARFGAASIDRSVIGRINTPILERVENAANALAKPWA